MSEKTYTVKSMWERQKGCKHESYDALADWCHDCQSVLHPKDAYKSGYDRAWAELTAEVTRQVEERTRVLRESLEWIVRVNAMDYEYRAVARRALANKGAP